MMVDTDDLCSNMDIAATAGVSKAAVTNWVSRHDSFPKPVASFSRGKFKIYLRSEVQAWLDTPRPRQPSKKTEATRQLFIDWMQGCLSNIGDHSGDFRRDSARFKDEAKARAEQMDIEWDDEIERKFQTG